MRDIYQEVTEKIIAELKNGVRPWVQPWSETPGLNVPCNAISGRPYHGVNLLLLWIARRYGWPQPRFLTFKQALALIERAGSMPKQGIASTFKYARAVGSLETVIACHDIGLIEPATWKKFHHLRGSDKEASRQRALQLFPTARTWFARKLDHQRAEAALLALTPVSGVLPRAKVTEFAEETA